MTIAISFDSLTVVPDLASENPVKLLSVPLSMSPSFFEHFLTFWSKFYTCIFLAFSQKSTISLSPDSFELKWYLGTRYIHCYCECHCF